MAAVLVSAACTPSLDWRDLNRHDSGGVQAQFPCRPVTQRRQLPLAGAPVTLSLLVCPAGNQTWALAHADVVDPARLAPALAELLASAASNVGAQPMPGTPLQVTGATPNPASVRVRMHGRLPDGRPMQMQVAVFTHGTQVFQATVLGEQVSDEASEIFLSSLHFKP